MLILGIDTSGKNGSIALARCESRSCETLSVVALEGGTFSAQLIPQISSLLQQQAVTKNQIDGFAVVSGPGSFTGLRVGLAAIKALAETLSKPIVAMSMLEVIARESGIRGGVLAALDAGRGEIYCAEYDTSESRARMIWQDLLTRQQFLDRSRNLMVVTPDGNVADLLSGGETKLVRIAHPRADVVARLGFEKFMSGETVLPEALDANYIRRSDAEIRHPTGALPR